MEQDDVKSFVADLNEVRDPDPDPEILTYLVSIWRDARSETPPGFLQDNLVQVELAITLAQAREKAVVDFDDELHEFFRRAARLGDGKIRRRAVQGLAVFRDPMDIPIIAQMTLDPDESTFRMAVIVLSGRCLREARAALDRAEPLLSKERAAFLAEMRDTYGCFDGR
jgi:hypothetical protein